jgi:hypothetical protein
MSVESPDDFDALFRNIVACRQDPLKFVLFAFPWGEGELKDSPGPRDWQRDILNQIGLRLKAGESPARAIRIAVASGHGVGKSALVAWLILWALSTRIDTKVVVTANTGIQLATKTWPELLTWHRRSINADWWTATATALASVEPGHERTWRADAIPWSETNTEAFAGLHNQHRRILLVFDEASAIDDRIWDVAEGALTDESAEILWTVFGNYTRNTGRFHETFGVQKHRWLTRQIDSRLVEGINKTQIQEWVDDYGEDSDFVRVRVRGVAPRSGTTQFISSESIAQASKRLPLYSPYEPLIVGVDVARFGEDESVIQVRRGRDARTVPAVRFQGIDTMQLVGHITSVISSLGGRVDALFVDETGVGGGVIDRLRQLGLQPIGVNNGGSADCPIDGVMVANKGAECWARMREWLNTGGSIADDADLTTQLEGRQYGFNAHNEIVLESKKDMKKRGLASPDRADALALTMAYPVALGGGSGFASTAKLVHDYDPLEALRSDA